MKTIEFKTAKDFQAALDLLREAKVDFISDRTTLTIRVTAKGVEVLNDTV